MQSTERTRQPHIQPIDTLHIPSAKHFRLSNNIPVYSIGSGTEEIVKIDMLFRAGNWFQPKPLVAKASNEMLPEGSKNYTSEEIAEKMDHYGALLKTNANKDVATVSLLTLKKYLRETLEILSDILINPTYPENELKTYIKNKKQEFLLERARVKHLSKVKFNKGLFGNHHPYGKILHLEDHDNVTREDLVEFHKNYYTTNNCEILLTGKIDESVNQKIDEFLGTSQWKKEGKTHAPDYMPFTTSKKEIYTPREDAVQSAIRIGKIIFGKHHPDFPGIQVLNTILGGYFGSRLMKTVREKKGYTYGIQSLLVSLVNEGYFVIVSEVGANVCRKAISAIYEEMKKLRYEKVSREEMDVVKNYMLGQLLRAFDGPLPTSAAYLNLMELRLKEDYYQQMVDTINQITPEDIQELANKYLKGEEMIRSIAGKCE
ncbi:MAG: M16 family metallopeptidase [Bacteroidales bacterium]